MTVRDLSFQVFADVWFSRRFSRIAVFHNERREPGSQAPPTGTAEPPSSAIATVSGQSRVSGLGVPLRRTRSLVHGLHWPIPRFDAWGVS